MVDDMANTGTLCIIPTLHLVPPAWNCFAAGAGHLLVYLE